MFHLMVVTAKEVFFSGSNEGGGDEIRERSCLAKAFLRDPQHNSFPPS
jgi:hypothetical protein